MRAATALLLLLTVACGGREQPGPSDPALDPAAQPGEAAAAATPLVIVGDDEPADAQARAEAVAAADFNRDKTTRLQMNMSTLVGRTSAISGFSTAVERREEKIDERLARLAARVTETEVVIQLSGAILFDFDSASLRPDAERALDDVRQVIASYAERPVRIEGHTDSVAGDDYNQNLSERRAKSVADWLMHRGVAGSRLTTAGLGESKPVAPNETREGRQKNRRVEIIIARK